MHGYSASGVFAQRFALIHPEMIKEVVIGGAIGSIPMPIKEHNGIQLDYPVGINNFEEISHKQFNFDAYKCIKFRYYVAELESETKSETRLTEDGEPAPMHDMSYMDRSIPSEAGQRLRDAYGRDLYTRCRNQLSEYVTLGIDIKAHEPYKGIRHNEIKNLAYKYIDDCLRECVFEKVKE